tara:strand:+ start:4293 stop:4844 length:552 start_codon:yes stop_codon:yes gene_type:complete
MKVYRITDEQDVNDLIKLSCQICEIDKEGLFGKSRLREYQLPRTVISNIARIDMKIHYNIIAKVLNRDRSSIYHYEKNHLEWYEVYKPYRRIFNKVYNAFTDLKYNLKKFPRPEDIKSFLLKKGVTEDINGKVLINIKCGDVETVMKTNYRNFSEHIELISLALNQDHYEFKLSVKLDETFIK